LQGGIIAHLTRNVVLRKVGTEITVNDRGSLMPEMDSNNNLSYLINISDAEFRYFYRFSNVNTSIFTRCVVGNAEQSITSSSFVTVSGGVFMAGGYGGAYATYHGEWNDVKLLNTAGGAPYGAVNTRFDNCWIAGNTFGDRAGANSDFHNCKFIGNTNAMTAHAAKSRYYDCYFWENYYTIRTSNDADFYNCVIGFDTDGVERPNVYDLIYNVCRSNFINCKMPTSVVHYGRNSTTGGGFYFFENYNQTLGDHRIYDSWSTVLKIDADGTGDNPTQRNNGNYEIWEMSPLTYCGFNSRNKVILLEQQIKAPSDLQRTFRYYVQTDFTAGLTSDEIWLFAEYYDTDTSMVNIQSDEVIAIRSNQSDWSQYVEVTVNPAADTWVRLRLLAGAYESGKLIWVDPKPEVI
jgi:hypothetical protein